jgi:hypothetical protein
MIFPSAWGIRITIYEGMVYRNHQNGRRMQELLAMSSSFDPMKGENMWHFIPGVFKHFRV